jgi:cytochrome P450
MVISTMLCGETAPERRMDLFEAKRHAPEDDMISRLVHAEEDGDVLDEDEILATVFLMFLAGHVTTVNLVANGVVALLTHPDQLLKFEANPELLATGGRGDAALLGTGRLHRPAPPGRTSRWEGR